MNIILDVRLYKDGQTKDELYRHINIIDNKRKNIRQVVIFVIDREIYRWFKNTRGNNITL